MTWPAVPAKCAIDQRRLPGTMEMAAAQGTLVPTIRPGFRRIVQASAPAIDKARIAVNIINAPGRVAAIVAPAINGPTTPVPL